MKRTLRFIAQAIQCNDFADVTVGYALALSLRHEAQMKPVVGFLRTKMLQIASQTRDVDTWTNAIDSMVLEVAQHDNASKAARRSVVETLHLLVPFARETSLVLAAEMLTEKREDAFEERLDQNEDIAIGHSLVELSQIAEARGQFELAAAFAERAIPFMPKQMRSQIFELSQFLDKRIGRRVSPVLGQRSIPTNIAGLHKLVTARQTLAEYRY